jgi:DNA polymerase elongation subunit (family B)
MRILYGLNDKLVDVTQISSEKLTIDGEIVIPYDDNIRARVYGDPVPGICKRIYLIDSEDNILGVNNKKTVIIPQDCDLVNNVKIKDFNKDRNIWWNNFGKFIEDSDEKLKQLHKRMMIYYGNVNEEYPEQVMATKYIRPMDRVLELGGNIGRNTLVISQILADSSKLVSMECSPLHASQLEVNRNNNDFKFHIEVAALSKQPLIQKGWSTMISDELLPGYTRVNTITWDELQNKYNLDFNVLVADCEGSLYYIFKEEPELLKNFERVIMENDYTDITHKEFVNEYLTNHGFQVVYQQSGGWGPCYPFFFEVWEKTKHSQ